MFNLNTHPHHGSSPLQSEAQTDNLLWPVRMPDKGAVLYKQQTLMIFLCFRLCSPHHAGCAPDVSWGTVSGSYQDLNGAVLSRLDVFCKVLMLFRREKQKHLAQYQFEGAEQK